MRPESRERPRLWQPEAEVQLEASDRERLGPGGPGEVLEVSKPPTSLARRCREVQGGAGHLLPLPEHPHREVHVQGSVQG